VTREDLVHLRRARDLIDREYDRPLDVPAIARAAHASPAHFARRYREAFGETPYQHLLTRRIERAMALLRAGELSVRDVCEAVGFHSFGSFSARFHELVGITPSAYREAHAPAPVPGCMVRALARPRPSRNRETAGAARG
jgi:AraC-like DNA-binding protein